MDNNLMIGRLEDMAERIAKFFNEGEALEEDAQLAQAYAQICTAMAALNAPKQFIQIGDEIFNRSDITRVAIEKKYPSRLEVCIYTKEIQPGPEGEGTSFRFSRSYHSEYEGAKALLAWLEPQTEVLVPYREDPPVAEGEEDI